MRVRNTLHESSVTAIRNCYNLLVVAAVYLLTILGLALLAIGFGEVRDRLAVFVGLDWKTQLLISYAGRSTFVILIVVSFALRKLRNCHALRGENDTRKGCD